MPSASSIEIASRSDARLIPIDAASARWSGSIEPLPIRPSRICCCSIRAAEFESVVIVPCLHDLTGQTSCSAQSDLCASNG